MSARIGANYRPCTMHYTGVLKRHATMMFRKQYEHGESAGVIPLQGGGKLSEACVSLVLSIHGKKYVS